MIIRLNGSHLIRLDCYYLPSWTQTSAIEALLQEARRGWNSRKLSCPQIKPEGHGSDGSQSPSPIPHVSTLQYLVSNLPHFPVDKQ